MELLHVFQRECSQDLRGLSLHGADSKCGQVEVGGIYLAAVLVGNNLHCIIIIIISDQIHLRSILAMLL